MDWLVDPDGIKGTKVECKGRSSNGRKHGYQRIKGTKVECKGKHGNVLIHTVCRIKGTKVECKA